MEMEMAKKRLSDTEVIAGDIAKAQEIQLTAGLSGVVPDDTYTVSEAINNLGFGKFQIIMSLIIGVNWMADSMEVMILSILGPALHCAWGISQTQQAVLTTVVFAGMMASSSFWGVLADRFGRKSILILSGINLFFYGLLSAWSPSFGWILGLRFLVGLSVGAVPQSVTLFSEFLPNHQRGRCVVLLDCFWAFGACLELFLAAVVMPLGGWRWLLALSALPSLVFVISALAWPLPESARFLAAMGHSDEVLDSLARVATNNKRPMILGRLTVDVESPGGWFGGLSELITSYDFRRVTLSLWWIWTACSFVYYGIVLMTTELFEIPEEKGVCQLNGQTPAQCSAQCRQLDRLDYTHLLWTALAEFPGILITVILIDKIGRKWTMASEILLVCLSLCFLYQCSSDKVWITIVLFFARGLASGVFQAAYVYTAEVYPTALRSIGVGTCSGMARLGATLTPYIAQVLMKVSLDLAISIYLVIGISASVCSALLPVETKGKDLGQPNNEKSGYLKFKD